jgi:hypothetical protein
VRERSCLQFFFFFVAAYFHAIALVALTPSPDSFTVLCREHQHPNFLVQHFGDAYYGCCLRNSGLNARMLSAHHVLALLTLVAGFCTEIILGEERR